MSIFLLSSLYCHECHRPNIWRSDDWGSKYIAALFTVRWMSWPQLKVLDYWRYPWRPQSCHIVLLLIQNEWAMLWSFLLFDALLSIPSLVCLCLQMLESHNFWRRLKFFWECRIHLKYFGFLRWAYLFFSIITLCKWIFHLDWIFLWVSFENLSNFHLRISPRHSAKLFLTIFLASFV